MNSSVNSVMLIILIIAAISIVVLSVAIGLKRANQPSDEFTFVKIVEYIPEASLYKIEIKNIRTNYIFPGYMSHNMVRTMQKDSLAGHEVRLKSEGSFYIVTFKQ